MTTLWFEIGFLGLERTDNGHSVCHPTLSQRTRKDGAPGNSNNKCYSNDKIKMRGFFPFDSLYSLRVRMAKR